MRRAALALLLGAAACGPPLVDDVTGARVTVTFDDAIEADSLNVSLLLDGAVELTRVVPERRRQLDPSGESFTIAVLDEDVEREVALRIDAQFNLETRASGLLPLPLERGRFIDVEIALGAPDVVGDGRIGAVETCDDGNTESRDGCSDRGLIERGFTCSGEPSVCTPLCGDGRVLGAELCDVGALNGAYVADRDASCNATCDGPGPHCGDELLEEGVERCDRGPANGAWALTEEESCNVTCDGPASYCGDGVRDFADGEDCDQGPNNNQYSNDPLTSCNATCDGPAPFCGDGVITQGLEECDDGLLNGSYDACESDCSGAGPACGDGVVQAQFELCDRGVDNGAYAPEAAETCSSTCAAPGPHCGDGEVTDAELCDDGVLNGDYGRCGLGCDGPGPRCGDGVRQAEREACDLGPGNGAYSTGPAGGCDALCGGPGPRCGDGIVQSGSGEACDDGLRNGTYARCAVGCGGPGARCGDGVLQPAFEACDRGVTNGAYAVNPEDGCNETCGAAGPHCGDGVLQADEGEACDDGVNNGAPGFCAADCEVGAPSLCGNGQLDDGEDCDIAGAPEDPSCDSDCTFPQCGDGHTNPTFDPGAGPERCDEGADNDRFAFYGCDADCQPKARFCGDGVVDDDFLEECDDGVNDGSYNTCDPDCTFPARRCGDGRVDGSDGESCDLGLQNGGYAPQQEDSCDADCQGPGPHCGDGVLESGVEECDEGADNDGRYGGCNPDCTLAPACGDGEVFAAEEACDDGPNNGRYAFCDADCAGPTTTCGDGDLDPGESCDDADLESFDGCNALCEPEPGGGACAFDRCRRCDPFQLPPLPNQPGGSGSGACVFDEDQCNGAAGDCRYECFPDSDCTVERATPLFAFELRCVGAQCADVQRLTAPNVDLSCEQGADCDFRCEAVTGQCLMSCTGGSDCTLECQASTCALDCPDEDCTLRCSAGAGVFCDMTSCTAPTTCANGTDIVCGARACP